MIVILNSFAANCQSFTIVSADNAFNDLSAQIESRTDLNGVKCGLLIIRCALDGIAIKGNTVGDIQRKDGEYWIYLTVGSKKVVIKHQKLLPLDIDLEELFKSAIKSSNTYIITLSIPQAYYSLIVNSEATEIDSNIDSTKFNSHISKENPTDLSKNKIIDSGSIPAKGSHNTKKSNKFNLAQESLLSAIESNLKNIGLEVEQDNDGLKFKCDGGTYFIEVDKDEINPMYVRLCRYIRFDDTFKRETAMRILNDLNAKYTIKASCKERNMILSAEMFVASADQFNYAFNDMLSLMKSAYSTIE